MRDKTKTEKQKQLSFNLRPHNISENVGNKPASAGNPDWAKDSQCYRENKNLPWAAKLQERNLVKHQSEL